MCGTVVGTVWSEVEKNTKHHELQKRKPERAGVPDSIIELVTDSEVTLPDALKS